MARNNPKVAYLEEALSFIESIPKSAGDKLLEIVHRVEADRHISYCHTWYNQEDPENTQEGDCQGRENQTRIF